MTVKDILQKTKSLLQSQRHKEAEDLLRLSSAQMPEEWNLLEATGRFLLKQGKSADAASYLRRALELRHEQQEKTRIQVLDTAAQSDDFAYHDIEAYEHQEKEFEFSDLPEQIVSAPSAVETSPRDYAQPDLLNTAAPEQSTSIFTDNNTEASEARPQRAILHLRKLKESPPLSNERSTISQQERHCTEIFIRPADQETPISTKELSPLAQHPNAHTSQPERSHDAKPNCSQNQQQLSAIATPSPGSEPEDIDPDYQQVPFEITDLTDNDIDVYETDDSLLSEFVDETESELESFDQSLDSLSDEFEFFDFSDEDEFPGGDTFPEYHLHDGHLDQGNSTKEDNQIDPWRKARRNATSLFEQVDWPEQDEHALDLMTDILCNKGWSRTKAALIDAISKNATLEEIEIAHHLRHIWKNTEHYWCSFRRVGARHPLSSETTRETEAAYRNLSWSQALAVVRFFNDIADTAEIQQYLDDEFDYWFHHPTLHRAFPVFIRFIGYRPTKSHCLGMASIGDRRYDQYTSYDELSGDEWSFPMCDQYQRLTSVGIDLTYRTTIKYEFNKPAPRYPI